MHVRSWPHCLATETDTGAWCRRRPTEGVFCARHAWEFRWDEAAKAATRLARARLVLSDPAARPWQRWRSTLQAARALSLHRSLLAKIEGAEGAIDSMQARSDLPSR